MMAGNGGGRSGDDDEVGNAGEFVDGFVSRNAKDGRALRIHGPDWPAEGAAHEVLQHGAADAAGAIGGADDGDRFGREDGGQRAAPDADEIVSRIDDQGCFRGEP